MVGEVDREPGIRLGIGERLAPFAGPVEARRERRSLRHHPPRGPLPFGPGGNGTTNADRSEMQQGVACHE